MLQDIQITPVHAQGRRDINIRSGDTVRVYQKVAEKGKVRIQLFEGVVIAMKHGTEPGATFTVRRVGSDGVVVEKIFPLYSPMIEKIEIIRRTKAKRARLYFLRDKTPKQTRRKLRRSTVVSEITNEKAPEPSNQDVETLKEVPETGDTPPTKQEES